MSFNMIYDERNRNNISKLADNTKARTLQWYQYCIDKKVQVLIYETIRTKKKQAENVKKGASQTMRSYHIVGQAFDFVPVDSKGKALWSISAYTTAKMLDCINYAKKLGFTWGGDWDNDGNWRDESFLDSPHFQLNWKGYGTDTFGRKVGSVQTVNKVTNVSDSVVKSIQSTLNSKYKSSLTLDGFYGDKTRGELLRALKIEMNKTHSKEMGRKISKLDGVWYVSLLDLFKNIVLSKGVKTSKEIVYILQASLYVNNHKEVGTLDGQWGDKTTKTLNNFRKTKGFKQDGKCGGRTWEELLG